MKKIILSIILVLVIVLSTTGTIAFASEKHGDSDSSNASAQTENRRSYDEESGIYERSDDESNNDDVQGIDEDNDDEQTGIEQDSDDEDRDDDGIDADNDEENNEDRDDEDRDDEDNHRTRTTTISGIITSLSSSRLKVDGRTVRLSRQTTIQGTLTVGATVEVKASRADDSLVARTITVVTPGTTPVVVIPNAPSGLTASVISDTRVDLTWTDNSNNETGFKLQRATNDAFDTGLTTITLGANVTSYSNIGLTASTTYYYRVLATNTAGDSAPSNSVTVTTLALPPPSTNQAPVLAAIGNKSVNTGVLLTFTLSATDTDGNALTYVASNLPSGSSFNPDTGIFSWTPTSTQAGVYTPVRFQVSDGSLVDFEDITITVTAASSALDGAAIYAASCTGCHGNLTTTRTLASFTTWHAGQTSRFSNLTPEQQAAVYAYISR